MLNTPWDTGSQLYRRLVLWALGLTGTGILLVLVGATARLQGLMLAALPLIAVGLGVHIAGLIVRARDTRRRLREVPPKRR